jgi:hypothetical protein
MAGDDRFPASDGEPSERWLTIYEVAGRFLARPDTVLSWVRDGFLPAEDRGRLGLRIPGHAVDALLTEHLRAEGFRSADHSFSSGVSNRVLTATEIPEQAVERQGAGWPFRRDGEGNESS